jgi:hypothetical protein
MVEKKIPQTNKEHFIKRAKSVKVVNLDVKLSHTRKCAELTEVKNCKITSEMKLTKKQQRYYSQVLEDQRDREERYMKKDIKKKLNKKLIVEGAL